MRYTNPNNNANGDTKMANFKVLLTDGTVGIASSIHDDIVGQDWVLDLHDENGLPIQVQGTIAEVLCEEEE
jgi:hypothetical protein